MVPCFRCQILLLALLGLPAPGAPASGTRAARQYKPQEAQSSERSALRALEPTPCRRPQAFLDVVRLEILQQLIWRELVHGHVPRHRMYGGSCGV